MEWPFLLRILLNFSDLCRNRLIKRFYWALCEETIFKRFFPILPKLNYQIVIGRLIWGLVRASLRLDNFILVDWRKRIQWNWDFFHLFDLVIDYFFWLIRVDLMLFLSLIWRRSLHQKLVREQKLVNYWTLRALMIYRRTLRFEWL